MAEGNAGEGNKIHKSSTEIKEAYFIFGRFQPPHFGHAHLINTLYDMAKEKGADPYVFPTSTTEPPDRNPLSIDRKIVYLKKMFPPSRYPLLRIINTTDQKCTIIYDVIKLLKEAGYEKLTLFVGPDRVKSFAKQFAVPKFVEDFGTVDIVAEKRLDIEPEITGISAAAAASASPPDKISATIVRGYVINDNRPSFAKATKIGTMTNANVNAMMSNVKAGLARPKQKKEKKEKSSSASAAAAPNNNLEGGTRKRKRKYRNVPSRRRRHH